jgi:DNA repair protein RadC
MSKFRHKHWLCAQATLYSVALTSFAARGKCCTIINLITLNLGIMESTQNQLRMLKAAEVELVYKSNVKACERPKITNAADAYKILNNSWNEDEMELRECFKIMLLSRANRVLGIYEVSKGGLTGVAVDIRMVFIAALKANAACLILAHNHPSGQLIESVADKDLTERIRTAGKIMDIEILDHLILTSEGYLSFVDDGLM